MTAAKLQRTSFGPVVLTGLATAGLTALAASRTWLHATGPGASITEKVEVAGSDAAPLALALGLVALAGWGVVLVSAARARRVAIVLGLIATSGALAVVIAFWSGDRSAAASALGSLGSTRISSVTHGPWYWITAVAAIGQLGALLVAFRDAPTWPTMSSRYDAPGERRDRAGSNNETDDGSGLVPAEPLADLELWKALDEGRDPTTRAAP